LVERVSTRGEENDSRTSADASVSVRALERGLQLIKCFSTRHPSWRIADLARAVNLHKATARRLVKTLESEDFLSLDPLTGEYQLGPALMPIAYLVRSHGQLVRIAHPYLEQLAAETQETVGLSVWTGDGVMHVDHVQTTHFFKPELVPGTVSTIYGTTHSKILLAYGPEERISKLTFGTDGPTLAPDRLTRLHEELERVRLSGIAWDVEERLKGVCAVGVPIRDSSGEVVASLSVVVPTERFGLAQREYIAARAKAIAAAISAKLGFSGERAAEP